MDLCFFNIFLMVGWYFFFTEIGTVSAVLCSSSFSQKTFRRFLAKDRFMTPSTLSSEGLLRYKLSTATPSTSPCVIGDSIIAVVCSTATATVWPVVRVFGGSQTLVMSIINFLCGVTWTMPLPTRQMLVVNSSLLGSTTMIRGYSVLWVTKVGASGWSVSGLDTHILVDSRFYPLGNCWASDNGNILRLLPPVLRIIGTVVP